MHSLKLMVDRNISSNSFFLSVHLHISTPESVFEVPHLENNSSCTSTSAARLCAFPVGQFWELKWGMKRKWEVRWSFRVCFLALLRVPHINHTPVPKWNADIILYQRQLCLLLRFSECGSEWHLKQPVNVICLKSENSRYFAYRNNILISLTQ